MTKKKTKNYDTSVKYKNTKAGLVTRIFAYQKQRSKKYEYLTQTYTKKELSEWLYSQKLFHELYDNWKKSGFKKEYVPSVDRKDDYIGYTMDNIQLMTWKENNIKGHRDRFNGTNNKSNKGVIQYEKNGDKIAEYYSISKAHRVTGITIGNISKCCKNIRKYAGGFIWEFS